MGDHQSEGVKVLMVTLSYQGHMNPMLKFAKQLVSKGVYVTIATTDSARDRLLNSKNSATLFNPNKNTAKGPGIALEFFSDGLSSEFDRNDIGSVLKSLRTEGARNLSNLISTLTASGNKFSCIITNPFVPKIANVTEEHGIPCATLWIQASAVFSIYYHHFRHPNLFPDLENPNETVELPGLPVLEVRDLPTFMLPSSPPHFHKVLSEFFQSLEKVKWLLGSSFYELEEDVVKSLASFKPIYSIGPLVSPFLLGREETIKGNIDMWTADDSCIEWLDKKPTSSVIYISFGSMILLSQHQVDSIATALKNTKRPFLWVIKQHDKVSEKKVGELSPAFLEETKDRGLVVSWSPQERVLTHPALACFMTHCGWNSTLETVVAGVPVIGYPEWTDQPTDAKLLEDVFKIGVRMRNGEDGLLSTKEVERCITEITDGPRAAEMKKRALEWKEAARKALIEEDGSSNQNIDRFISEILKV